MNAFPAQDILPADLSMGTVTLKAGNMDTLSRYYQKALGLDVVAEGDGGLYLGRGSVPLVHLVPAAGLKLPGRGEAGLFHTAFLFEDRAALAATVATAAAYQPQSFVGSADHLVSEAFYFTDPEGNGIELYFDKPREGWQWRQGQVVIDNRVLQPRTYLEEHLTEEAVTGQRRAAAEIGHVHLQVGDVPTAHRFYVDVLGFRQTADWHGQALFVAAGGYHHHMGMNVWNSRGAGPRRDTLGLGEVLIRVPDEDEVGALADRLRVAGVQSSHTGAELTFEDPWRNRIRVAVD